MLHGVKWGDLSKETKTSLLERVNVWDDVKEGDCLVDLTEELTVEGKIIDGEIVIKDNAIIYNPQIGKPDISHSLKVDIDNVLTAQEAATKWGITEGAIRKAIASKRLIIGIDYRKAGRITLISKEAMERLYGELEYV